MAASALLNTEELITALQNGDEQAFKLLFNYYYKPLVAFISIYTQNQDDSEDLAQQSFISLWNNRTLLRLEASPKSYLYKIAYNQYIDQYRKSLFEQGLLEELRLEILRNAIVEDDELTQKNLLELKKIIEELPPKCKLILTMSRQQGLDYNEISDKLDISPRTVEEQIRIAFKKIRKAFEEKKLLKKVLILCFSIVSRR